MGIPPFGRRKPATPFYTEAGQVPRDIKTGELEKKKREEYSGRRGNVAAARDALTDAAVRGARWAALAHGPLSAALGGAASAVLCHRCGHGAAGAAAGAPRLAAGRGGPRDVFCCWRLLLGAAAPWPGGIAAVTGFARQIPALMTGLAQGLDRLEGAGAGHDRPAPEEVADTCAWRWTRWGDALRAAGAAVPMGAGRGCAGLAQAEPGPAALRGHRRDRQLFFLRVLSPECWPFCRPRCLRASGSG